jgi:crotonobetainyl-CoA:carnitine CoA-transferase CaiB-like acyl-CoA transferase
VPALARRDGRRAAESRIDAELARVCAPAERDALVDRLLAAGVPAAPVLHPSELTRNPQVRARGFLESVAHPVTGEHELPGLPMRIAGMTRWYRAPAPTLGEHTAAVLHEVLGVDDAELARLRADGIVGDRPAGI